MKSLYYYSEISGETTMLQDSSGGADNQSGRWYSS